jgi:energy-coupling factor transporter transmembrane protein EcfT
MRGYRMGKRTRVHESTLQQRDFGALLVMVVAGCGYIALLANRVI